MRNSSARINPPSYPPEGGYPLPAQPINIRRPKGIPMHLPASGWIHKRHVATSGKRQLFFTC